MRRVMAAAAVAIVLAAGALVVEQTLNNVGQPSPCSSLNPDTNWFQWWYYGCDGTAGGGGSGAGEL